LIRIKSDQTATWFDKLVLQGAIPVAHLVDKLHVNKPVIDRVESIVLLSVIGCGLTICVLGAAVYDFGRLFSIW
jgi:hypothetical protein